MVFLRELYDGIFKSIKVNKWELSSLIDIDPTSKPEFLCKGYSTKNKNINFKKIYRGK